MSAKLCDVIGHRLTPSGKGYLVCARRECMTAVLQIRADTSRFDEAMRRARGLPTAPVDNAARGDASAEQLAKLRRAMLDVSNSFGVTFAKLSEGFAAFGQALARVMRSQRASVAHGPVPHGFTPSLDLVCGVCGVGPEECRGGRP